MKSTHQPLRFKRRPVSGSILVNRPRLILKSIAVTAFCAALPSFAATCSALQTEIEAKIRNAGVAQFAVTIADANSPAPGKVVGTCEMGAKKLLYTVGQSPANVAFAPPVPPKPQVKTDAILTECKDGSVSMGGDCKK
jgi:hypothetical protein